MTCKTDNWTGCYDLGWQKIISPQSFSHPAKFSRGLIFRIIEHALEEGWIQPGQTILDPFGGVALGALPALQNGLNWVGCELEPRFVELGRQNINLWNGRFSGMPKWTGQAQLLQGDSRRLAEVVRGAGLVVSSPPYAESLKGDNKPDYDRGKIEAAKESGVTAQRSTWGVTNSVGVLTGKGYGSADGNLGNLPPGDIQAVISSPPFAGNSGGRGEASRNGIDAALFDRHSGGMKGGTGSDPANLDHLPMGTAPIAIVSSPPYADGCAHTGGDDPHPEHIQGGKNGVYGVDSYGGTPGQLGGMKAGAVISSPPFENSLNDGLSQADREKYAPLARNGRSVGADYGSTAGQIGATQGDTFWAAARLIVEQCYGILPPNACAIWVVKNYIKNGAEVDLTGQWQQLCEACGFETIHIHRAMLVKDNGEQETMAAGHDTTGTTTNLLGEEVTTAGKPMLNKKNIVARKSFFRRLHERKNPHLAIDFETVLCMRKPA